MQLNTTSTISIIVQLNIIGTIKYNSYNAYNIYN